MAEILLAAASALWLGILTSISPCPLATNIAAISYIGRDVGKARRVFFSGFLYAAGRTLTYLVLGILLVASLLSMHEASYVLQKYMNKVMGPLLILVGMFLLELISIDFGGSGFGARFQEKAKSWGVWGALPIGVIFALSFCPVSAALFFGSLIPLALKNSSCVLLPGLYGVGTAVPVIVFAVLLAFGAQWVGKAFKKLTQIEKWARWITGIIFLGVGVYFCFIYIFLA
ncbi:MAG: cytochrome C biogenesis protein [Bdellovibrionales bacterium RIFOXYD1_FULL_53_11]|nr:MAG: cytochrome C biogenesis protein [Bdellovibrionales bacterium RIFOXYD1_FULL_53_11]